MNDHFADQDLSEEALVGRVADEFTERLNRGEQPDVEEYARLYPPIAALLRQVLPALQAMGPHASANGLVGARGTPQQLPGHLGDFRIIREVGRGGMGVVYEAEQESLGRRVALKVLHLHAGQDPRLLERFRRESRAAAQLHHTNIVPVHEVGQQDGLCYYAMQFIRGQALDEVFCELQHLRASSVPGAAKGSVAPAASLAQSLRTGAFEPVGSVNAIAAQEPTHAPAATVSMSLPAELSAAALPDRSELSSVASDYRRYCRNVARLGLQAAEALAYAHGRGIVHRDIKPANLLLDSTGVLWVSDFGLVKTQDPALTDTGDLVGTLRYMAPERFRGECDARADVYALGLTLYELLVLRPAFDGQDRLHLVDQISRQEPARPRTLDPRIPRDLETILMKAIEKDPRRRYPSAEALAGDLRRFLADEPIQARRIGPLERLGRWGRRNPLVAGLSAAVVLVAVLGFVGVFGQMQVAVAHEQEAQENARQAQKNEQDANKQRDDAQTANEQLRATQAELRSTLYAAHMNLIQHAWEEPAIPRMLELLDRHRPKPGEPDLRGFEWHYFHRLYHADVLHTLKGAGHSVVFSPDGKRLAASEERWASPDGKRLPGWLKVWDAQTGQELYTQQGFFSSYVYTLQGWSSSVVFSPDGKRLACGSSTWDDGKNAYVAGEVKVLDAQTGQELLTCKGHTDFVSSVAFSPDGKRLASAALDKTTRVWDAQTGQELLTRQGGSGGVAFSPDSKRLANGIGSELKDGQRVPSGGVKVWDAQTGQELLSLPNGGDGVAFSPDGQRLASKIRGRQVDSMSVPEEVKVWDAQTGQELFSLHGPSDGSILCAFSPDGKRLATAKFMSRPSPSPIKVSDAQTGQEIFTLQGHTAGVNSLVFSPDSKRLASGSGDRTLRIWDLQTGREIRTLKGHAGMVWSVDFSPDGKRLASASFCDGTVKVWDAQKDPETLTLKKDGVTSVATFSPNFSRLAGVAADNTVKVWDASSGQETLTLKGHTNNVRRSAFSLAFSPDGKRLATASGREVKVWDAQTGQELFACKGHTPAVISVVFSPDGKRLASRSGGRSPRQPVEVKVWDAQTGQELLNLQTIGIGQNDSIAFSPDGKRLASGGREVKVWDAQTGQELLSLPDGGSRVAFSPDGKRLAGASWDLASWSPTMKVWDAQTGQEILTFNGGHTDIVMSLAFSPDGKRLASGSQDQTVKVWDAQTGQEMLTLKGHTGSVGSVAFSADGYRLASASNDGTVKIWDATPLPAKP
jgi:WD40 repeat protein/serine/threonine protein kinase